MRAAQDEDCLRAIELIETTGCYMVEAAAQLGCCAPSLSRRLKKDEWIERYQISKLRCAMLQEAKALAAIESIDDDDTDAAIKRKLALANHHKWAAEVRDKQRYGKTVQVQQEVKISLAGVLADMSQRVIDITDSGEITPAISGSAPTDSSDDA